LEEEKKPLGFRNVVALGVVSFFTDLSTEMILGLLPVFLVEELKASLSVLGLIDGVADALNYALRIVSGFISDKLKARKIVVLTGYAISNFAKPAFALARTWIHVFAVRVTDRIGKGVRTSARDALIAESVKGEKLGKAFGIHRTLDQIGAIVGPLVAAALTPLIGFRGVFALSLLPGVAALLVLALMVKEPERKEVSKKVLEGASQVLTRDFKLFLIAVGVFSIGAYSFSFLLVRARTLGVAAALIPVVYSILNVTHTAMGIPAGTLADKIGGSKTLSIGYATLALTSILAMKNSVTTVLAASLAYGVYLGIGETVQRAYVAKLAPKELKGTAYGIYYIVVGSLSMIANVLFGYLWDHYTPQTAFTYSTITSILAATLMLALLKGRK